MKKTILALMLLGTLSGCGVHNARLTDPNNPNNIQTTKSVPTHFNEFWDSYVERLSQDFFVINNISKESRIINVSFSTNKPSDYIDCGMATRSWKGMIDVDDNSIRYNRADPATYYQTTGVFNEYIVTINDTAFLEGRANIYIAPDGEVTNVRIAATYVWTGGRHIYYATEYGAFNRTAPNTVLSFNTTTIGSNGYGMKCISNGQLEKTLLDFGS